MPTAVFGVKENRRFHPFSMPKNRRAVRLKSIDGVQLQNVNTRISSLIKVTSLDSLIFFFEPPPPSPKKFERERERIVVMEQVRLRSFS